jgi:hypothetical protein
MLKSLQSARGRRVLSLATFALSALGAALFCFIPNGSQLDYPIQVISAQRILHGEIPYVDFQVLYGPIGHYFAALVEWPLRSLPPATAANCFYYLSTLLFLVLVIHLASRIPPAEPAVFLAALFVIFISVPTLAILSYYSLPSLLPLFLAMVCATPAIQNAPASYSRALYYQAATGTLLAIEVFTRINFGVYLGIAIAITGLLAFLFGLRQTAIAALRCLAFALVASSILLLVFTAAGMLRPAIADMMRYIPRAAASRNAPWRSYANRHLLRVTSLAVALFLLWVPRKIIRRQIDGTLLPYLVLCAFVSYSLFRFDPVHLYPLIALLLIIGCTPDLPPARTFDPNASGRRSRVDEISSRIMQPVQLLAVSLFALVPFGGDMGLHTIHPALDYWRHPAKRPIAVNGIPISSPELDLLARLNALRTRGEAIYWAGIPGSCQTTTDMCVNLALYLADRSLPATKIWFFDTASTPYEDVQRQIIQDLEKEKTPWIGMQGLIETNSDVPPHPEVNLLQNYVLDHYAVAFTDNMPELNRRYVIYSRKRWK